MHKKWAFQEAFCPHNSPHNPEAEGSSPSSATKKVLISPEIRTFSLLFVLKSSGSKSINVDFGPNEIFGEHILA